MNRDTIRDLLNEWRIWFLITALLAAGMAIGPHYDDITEDGEERTTIATNINQGLELQGGARVLIQPQFPDNATVSDKNEISQQVINTLKTRVEAFGYQGMNIRSVSSLTGDQQWVQVEMAGANTTTLKELVTRQGQFFASLSMRTEPGETITFEDTTFNISGSNETLEIDGQTAQPGETITLSTEDFDIPVRYENRTSGQYYLLARAFSGNEITGVNINPTQAGVSPQGNGYQFQFQISVTQEAAQQELAIAQNFEKGAGQDGRLQGTRLVLTLDDNVMNALTIANAFKDQAITTPTISGGGNSSGDAERQMNEMISILRSGALPVPIEVVSTNQVSARLGQQFFSTALIAILASVVGVGILIFLRYNNPAVALPITITGFSEVLVLLGVFSTADITPLFVAVVTIPTILGMYAGLRNGKLTALSLPIGTMFLIWAMQFSPSMDLAAIAGIIAAVGTGVDDQIIITDERAYERVKSLKKRLKRAFFIIFTSAASTIGAMLPVMAIGAGAVRGFAVTTILGVLIGISITRPAYARILDIIDA